MQSIDGPGSPTEVPGSGGGKGPTSGGGQGGGECPRIKHALTIVTIAIIIITSVSIICLYLMYMPICVFM